MFGWPIFKMSLISAFSCIDTGVKVKEVQIMYSTCFTKNKRCKIILLHKNVQQKKVQIPRLISQKKWNK